MAKRGQAALESLLTWGIALAFCLAVISALTYIHFVDPSLYVISRCTIAPAVSCEDVELGPTGVTITIRNNQPDAIENVLLNVEDCAVTTGPVRLSREEMGTYQATCLLPKGKFETKIGVTYTNTASSLEHTLDGILVGKVE